MAICKICKTFSFGKYCKECSRIIEENNIDIKSKKEEKKILKIKKNRERQEEKRINDIKSLLMLNEYTILEISNLLNIEQNKVRYICKRYNIEYKRNLHNCINCNKKAYLPSFLCCECIKERNINLINDYSSGNYTFEKLSKKYNCTKSNISRILLNLKGSQFIKSIHPKRKEYIYTKEHIIKKNKNKQEHQKFVNETQKLFNDKIEFNNIIKIFKDKYSNIENINKFYKSQTWLDAIKYFCKKNKIKYRKCNYCKKLTYNDKYCNSECMSKCRKLKKKQSDNITYQWMHNDFRKKQAKAKENKSIYWQTEKLIEDELIKLNINYIPQKEICGYSVDFYLPDNKLIIECDGDYWHANKNILPNQKYIYDPQYKNGRLSVNEVRQKDKIKDDIFIKNGYKVIRFWENKIKKNIEECINQLKNEII